jgi:hypothetical protein
MLAIKFKGLSEADGALDLAGWKAQPMKKGLLRGTKKHSRRVV